MARLSWEIYATKHAHHQTLGSQNDWIRLARNKHNGGMMSSAGPSHGPARDLGNPIPDRKIFTSMLLSLECLIQLRQYLVGSPHVGARQGARAYHVSHGDR